MKGNYIYYSDSDIFYSAQTGIALYIILIGTSAGNDVVATIFIILFFPPFFSPLSQPFLREGVLGSNTYLANVA